MAASQNPLSPPTLLDRFFIYGAGGGSTLSICSSLAACAGTAHIGPASMLILSTVAQTSSPRHSPGWPDLKLSPHPI